MADRSPTPWWRHGVIYQIYIRSFADSNGDGIGDLRGVLEHLDHLAWLGVDGIWLSPVTVSPNADWGYDVADYCAVDREYGTLADLDLLVQEAGRVGIRVLLDLVPNHTSDRHPWFVASRASRDAPKRDWYVWADPKPTGEPPNNWVSSFGGPAWTLDPPTGQYYLHNFLPEQPDLNWWNKEVRAAFDDIMAFWWDRGIAGFRIDCCHMIVKDDRLRDNPPATEDDPWLAQVFGQRDVYASNRPEVHGVLRSWRQRADAASPPRVLLGETTVHRVDTLATYYGDGHDELHLAFNFPFIEAPFEAAALRAVVEETEGLLPSGAWPVWTGSNHDMSRLATRWAAGRPERVASALVMLLTLRGTPVLYQGDEIGLQDVAIEREDVLDPVGERFWPVYPGRDPQRTPMPWDATRGGGFSAPGVRPWLPVGDPARCNVASQRDDPGSPLVMVRDLLALRRTHPDLHSGDYRSLPSPEGVWAWRRGQDVAVVLNLSDTKAEMAGVAGRIALCTDRRRDGEAVRQKLALAPWHAVVIRLGDHAQRATGSMR